MVLGQCLGGEEHERRGGTISRHRFGDGDLEAQRLARGCSRGDGHGFPCPCEINGLGLMRPEIGSTEGFVDGARQRCGWTRMAGTAGGEVFDMDEPGVLLQ